MLDNFFMLAFLYWPLITMGAGLINNLFAWKFSYSELILNYLIGFVIGICFYFGTTGTVEWYEHLFLMVSTGLFGLLKWAGVDYFANGANLFYWTAFGSLGVVVLACLLDLATAAIGKTMNVGGGFLSVLIFIIKAPFCIVTSLIGLLLGLIGLCVAAARKKGGMSFLGGAFIFEWGGTGTYATTFGWTVNIWQGTTESVLEHELYHTRQYVYMHDWLGIFYFTIAGIWGLISSAAANDFQGRYYYAAHTTDEYGNPIESVPYRKWG